MDSVGKFAKIMHYGKSLFQNLRKVHPLWASALAAQLIKSGNSKLETSQQIETVLKTLANESGKPLSIAIASSSSPAPSGAAVAPVVSPMIKLKNINPGTPVIDMSNVKINESDIKGNGTVSASVIKRKIKPKAGKGSKF